MGANYDKAKGHLKEAAGEATDNPRLKTEGKVDRAKGHVKEGINRVADKVKKASNRA